MKSAINLSTRQSGIEKGFWEMYFNMIIKPSKTLPAVFDHPRKIRLGLQAVLIPALGYTLFYILAWNAGGAPSSFKPWLALPIEQYFKYDIFLSLPAYFISWILASGTLYLLARLMGGTGNYDDTLVALAFGIGIATWSSMLHDLTDAILGFAGIIDMREYEKLLNEPTFWRYLLLSLYFIYFAWFIILFSLGIENAHKLNRKKSLLLGFTGLVVFQTMLLIFIR